MSLVIDVRFSEDFDFVFFSSSLLISGMFVVDSLFFGSGFVTDVLLEIVFFFWNFFCELVPVVFFCKVLFLFFLFNLYKLIF